MGPGTHMPVIVIKPELPQADQALLDRCTRDSLTVAQLAAIMDGPRGSLTGKTLVAGRSDAASVAGSSPAHATTTAHRKGHPMKVKAKFKCESVTRYTGSVEVKMNPVCADEVEENQRFHKYTPCGELKMQITNENLFDSFVPGKNYYVDITPAE